jgi:hypothetical protein
MRPLDVIDRVTKSPAMGIWIHSSFEAQDMLRNLSEEFDPGSD